MMTPSILKETSRGITAIEMNDSLLEQRKIFLTEEVNVETMTSVLKQLMYLEEKDPSEEITIYINSRGGEVINGLAVYDYIRDMQTPVRTVCTGIAASMGAILFLAGDKREMLPHTRVMIHDPSTCGRYDGQKPAEVKEQLESLMNIRKILCDIIADRSGMSMKTVRSKTQKDTRFTAEQAIENGIATKIIRNNNKEVKND